MANLKSSLVEELPWWENCVSNFFIYLKLSNFNDAYAGNAGKLYYSDFTSKNKEDTDNRMLFEEMNYSYKSVSLSKSNLISIYQYTKNKIKVLNYSRICYISQDAGREQKEKFDRGISEKRPFGLACVCITRKYQYISSYFFNFISNQIILTGSVNQSSLPHPVP